MNECKALSNNTVQPNLHESVKDDLRRCLVSIRERRFVEFVVTEQQFVRENGEIRAIDPDQPLADVRTLDQVVAKSIARPRFDMMLLGIFAAVALVLASVGLYGVMNYSATQRTQEIGIRMALGAKPGDILRLVVGHGMKLTVAGIALGVIASLGLTRVMTNLLFGVTATDLPTFLGVSALLTVVALLANYIPARRATRVNPVTALRYE